MIYGAVAPIEIHSIRARLGILSVRSPYCHLDLDFDLRFDLSGLLLRVFLAKNQLMQVDAGVIVAITGIEQVDGKEYFEIDPLKLGLVRHSLSTSLARLGGLTSYSETFAYIEHVCRCLSPDREILVNELDEEFIPCYINHACL